jgi:nitrite reductase (NADH) small subunit
MNDWIEIGRLDEIPRLGSRVISNGFGDIAVFRTGEDKVFAVRDRCPHKGGPLSQGIVHGTRISCPLHNWVIDLESGQALAPDAGETACFPIKLEDGVLWLKLR